MKAGFPERIVDPEIPLGKQDPVFSGLGLGGDTHAGSVFNRAFLRPALLTSVPLSSHLMKEK